MEAAMPPPPPKNMTYRIEKLNPLAFPKGQSLSCELLGTPALVSLVTPYITLHFATAEVAKQAWEGILCKIAHVLGPLLSTTPLMGSEEERSRRLAAVHASKHSLIALCREEAARHVVQGKFELAIPAARYALRFGTSIYGEGKVELVPAYLLLAEANLGLLNYRGAEEYLTLANWSLLKTTNCSNALRSQLRRNFGKLYASQGKFEDALKQLADDVYYSSLMVGPEHIDTAGGYFQLGNVFFSMNKVENSLAMFDKVVDIWYKCVAALLSPDGAPTPHLSEAKGSEGVEMLTHIKKRREECVGKSNIATGESNYIIGLLYHYLAQTHAGDLKAAQSHMRTALYIYETQLGAEHQSTKDVAKSLAQLESAMAGGQGE